MIIEKPGKSKDELMKCLENLENVYEKEIKEYDLQVIKSYDGYSIRGKKKILFMNFYLNAQIMVYDGKIEVKYDTNVPAGKVDEVLCKVEEVIGKC